MDLLPLDTPVLKVSRPVAACSRCRNAKIKCDGKLPACSSCEKNGRAAECTSTNDQFARGKERSYVSTLETRIDRLQARLEEAHARKPSVVSVPDDETPVRSRRQSTQVGEEAPAPNTSRAQKRREVTAIDDLVSDFGFLSVNATARDFYGFTSAMSYARLVLSACSKEDLPKGITKALPPRHAATALMQYYLNNVFVLLPLFEEASFYASVDSVYSRDGRKADPLDHWMVRMVLAISNLSMSKQRGDQHYLEGISHVCSAIDQAEYVLHPGNISGLQALLLLAQYAMLDPHHFDSWSLIGAASRAMTDLGFHQDPPKGTQMTKSKLDLRRRVFYCIYCLDRSTSIVQTRAFSFGDDSAKVKVPFSKHSSATPGSPAARSVSQPGLWMQSHEHALDLIKLRRLQSAWYTQIFQSGRTRWADSYTPLWEKCEAMRKWFDDISPSTTQNMRRWFELDLLFSYVYILSPSARVPAIHAFAQKLIFEYCIRYANLMLDMNTDQTYSAPLTFYDAMRVYMTGRQYLDVLQQNADMLLSGQVPPHPEVKVTASAPPPMPNVVLPPGTTAEYFNTTRSINCIKQMTECLALFGIRFGFMSWNQRYQNESAPLLNSLEERLQRLQIAGEAQRPTLWQHSSNGSINSRDDDALIRTVSQGSAPGQPVYQYTPPPIRQMPSFGQDSIVYQGTPQFYQQPEMYAQQQQPMVHALSRVNSQGEPQHDPPHNFQEHVYYNQPTRTAPNQQFAAWRGYDARSQPQSFDEETAVSPKYNSWHVQR